MTAETNRRTTSLDCTSVICYKNMNVISAFQQNWLIYTSVPRPFPTVAVKTKGQQSLTRQVGGQGSQSGPGEEIVSGNQTEHTS